MANYMQKHLKILVIIISLSVLTGCSILMPSSKMTTKSQWKDFNDAKTTYENIISDKTTVEDLKKMGYDPHMAPNIRIMTVTEILTLFLPNPTLKIEDLDPGIQKCIERKDKCTGYQIIITIQNSDRIGNFWLDLLSFKRHTVSIGWEFRGLITIVDNVVSYRDPACGRPLIHTEQVDIKPLGPFQEIGNTVAVGVSKLWGW
jgi:hypothetical protein